MKNEKYMIDARLIPDQDHSLIVDKLCKGRYALSAIKSYVNSYRRALGTIRKIDVNLLNLPITERFSELIVHLVVIELEEKLHPSDVIRMTQEISNVLAILTGHKFPAFVVEVDRVRKAAKAAGVLSRPARERKAVPVTDDFPIDHRDFLEHLENGVRNDGTPVVTNDGSPLAIGVVRHGASEYVRYLYTLEQAGVPWKTLKPIDLISERCLRVVALNWCKDGVKPERIRGLIYIFKKVYPKADFSAASKVMSECRSKLSSKNIKRKVLKNVGIEGLPLEDIERFAFACPEFAAERGLTRYSPNEIDFEFQGRSVALVRLPSKISSQERLFAALRAMMTVIHESMPEMAKTPIDSRDYNAISMIYFERYKDLEPSAVVARLQNLLSILNRILPVNSDLSLLRELLSRVRGRVTRKKVVVPNISENEIKSKAIAFIERSHLRFKELLELEKPYLNPKLHILYFRDSLILAFLAMEPLRRTCLTTLNIEDFASIDVDNITIAHWQIDGSRMKNGKTYDFFVDEAICPWLRIYLDELRGLIAPDYDGRAFWVSTLSKRLSPDSVYDISVKTSRIITGVEIKPHDFRRIIASDTISTGCGSYRLGHRSARVTRRYESDEKRAQISRVTSLRAAGDKFWDIERSPFESDISRPGETSPNFSPKRDDVGSERGSKP